MNEVDFLPDPYDIERLGRAETLLERFFDRTLDEKEATELWNIWDQTPQAEAIARKQNLTEQSFRLLRDVRRRPSRVQMEKWEGVLSALSSADVKPTANADDRFESETVPRKRVRNQDIPSRKLVEFRPWHIVLILAVVAVYFMAIYHEFHAVNELVSHPPQMPFHSIATVSASIGFEGTGNGDSFKEGRQLEPGRIFFSSGILELTLKNGVRLALEGPVDFQMTSQSRTFLGRGRVSATVPPTGKGFEIATPLMSVVDLGTEFSLQIDDDAVETHTLTGKVELTRMPNGHKKLLEGNACRIDSKGGEKFFNADATTFLTSKSIRQQVFDRQLEAMTRWRESQTQWNADPSLLIGFDFEETGTVVPNRSRHGAAVIPAGSSASTSRVEGRWQKKNAVRFHGKHDVVTIDVPKTLNSVTLFLSFRADSLKRYHQSLLASRQRHEGEVYWLLNHEGSLQLLLRENGAKAPRIFDSPPVLSRDQWGTWCTVATVVDAGRKRVVHYFEGRKIAEIPFENHFDLRIGEATLGNCFLAENRKTDRSFDGRFDQFLFFDRAFSEKEIQRLHDSLTVY